MFVENALVYLEFNPIIELIFLYKLGNEIDGGLILNLTFS